MRKTLLAIAISNFCSLFTWATANEIVPTLTNTPISAEENSNLEAINVIGHLDESRNRLSPDTGSSQYLIDQKAIEELPLGTATPLNQLLLQAPGVANDSFGQLHVRGDHANLQYRINGVIIPESINGFGQTLDTHFSDHVELLTGALPAQYGYRTAGVVNITSKSGIIGNSANVDITVGAFGTVNPNLEAFGATDRFNYYVNVNFLESDLGIENPTDQRRAIHDHTDQFKGFGYLSYLLNDTTRASLLFGSTNNRFQIPNNPNQTPSYSLAGISDFSSMDLDERQHETTRYGIAAVQGTAADSDYQIALFQRYTSIDYQPDPIGDLIFNGVAAQVDRSNRSTGVQADLSRQLSDTHTLRYGLFLSRETAVSNNHATVFPADVNGNQISIYPIELIDDTHKNGALFGAYVQDEWKLSDTLTVNYGVRADHFNAFVSEGQVSPRIGAVYQWSDDTTMHAGYARYFTPPPMELIAPTDIALFQNTTNALASDMNTDVLAERSHYFDIGISHKVNSDFTLGLDSYYRIVRNLLDEGQFGQALVFSPFNYERGRIYGLELTGNYTHGNFSVYANLATGKAEGKDIVSGQFNFSSDELKYISQHYVPMDHDQKLTASGGISYLWNSTRYSADFTFGSGLRRGFANSEHLPAYSVVNIAATRSFDLPAIGKLDTRLAVLNLFDRIYELRDGSGIGVGAPQFGLRRGMYVGVSKQF